MKRKQFSDEPIIGILKVAQAGAVVKDWCRRHGMSSANYFAQKAKFDRLEASDSKSLLSVYEEKAGFKQLVADTMPDNAGLKSLLLKNRDAYREAGSGHTCPDGAGDEPVAAVCRRRKGLHKHAVSLDVRCAPCRSRRKRR